jgi:hypothetical protein
MHNQNQKMKRLIVGCIAIVMASAVVFSQKAIKPWSEWNRKDAEKILNDSAWSQSQTDSQSQSQQASDTPTNMGDTRGREEAVRNVTTNASISFHVRFFSARPIRQAYVRLLQLAETTPSDPAAAEKMTAWANLAADDRIIVTVSCTGDDRSLGRVIRTFRNAKLDDLKTAVYLERKDGKRAALTDYAAPAKDLFGARFTFPRAIDGQPFITSDSGIIRFHAEYSPGLPEATTPTAGRGTSGTTTRPEQPYKLRLDLKFKIAEMIYNGELEY